MDSQASAEAPQRRKLNLKPRDESAATKAEAERKSARSVPVMLPDRFGKTFACNALTFAACGPFSRSCSLTVCCSQNPFGAAKPREQTLAAKQGKKEEDILKEELSKDKFSVSLAAV